ncbi:MAG: hypothetical protein WA081_21250 [Desulfosalsimonadaceae bacterium]
MAKIQLSGNVDKQSIVEYLRKKLHHNIREKGKRIEVIKGALSGCIVRVQSRKSGRTNLFTGPFMPSTSLAIVITLIKAGVALLLIVYVNVVLGVRLFVPGSLALRFVPSQAIVAEITEALGRYEQA